MSTVHPTTGHVGHQPDVKSQAGQQPDRYQAPFVVDGVIHAFNLIEENTRTPLANDMLAMTYGLVALTGDADRISQEDFLRDWSITDLAEVLFAQSDVDVGVFHGVPWWTTSRTVSSPTRRALRCVDVGPTGSCSTAPSTLWHPTPSSRPTSRRRRVATRSCRSRWCTRAMPLSRTRPTCSCATPTSGRTWRPPAPMWSTGKARFADTLGGLLATGAWDRIIFASGAVQVHPQTVLEAFYQFQIPSEMTEGYGVPQITDEMRDGILGLNLARLHGLDVNAMRDAICEDEFSDRKANGLQPRWALGASV